MKRKYSIPIMFTAVVLSASLVACKSNEIDEAKDQIENIADAEDEHVLGVKNGSPSSYPDKTYAEAFEQFFSLPTWKYFVGTKEGADEDGDGEPDVEEKNVDIVEFTGYCTYLDVEVKARIQFTLSDDGKTFSATFLSFNDVPQNMLTLSAVIEAAFTNEDGAETQDDDLQNENLHDEDILDAFIECLNQHADAPDYEGEELREYYRQQYESWKENPSDSHIIQNADGTFTYIDYMSVFAPIVDTYLANYDDYAEYTLYDFDGDGTKELIISYGTCDADWENSVFIYNEDGAELAGSFDSTVVMYPNNSENGIYSCYVHMDEERVQKVTLENGSIHVIDLKDSEIQDISDSVFVNEPLEITYGNDYGPLY